MKLVYVSFMLELAFLFLNRWKTGEIFQTIHDSLSLICIEFGVKFQIIFYAVLCVIVATRMGSWFQQQKQCVEINSEKIAKLKENKYLAFQLLVWHNAVFWLLEKLCTMKLHCMSLINKINSLKKPEYLESFGKLGNNPA